MKTKNIIILWLILTASNISAQTFEFDHPHLREEKNPYEWNLRKSLGLTNTAVVSFLDGFIEGYDFYGRDFFEINFDADPYGFWGSESWRRVDGDLNAFEKLTDWYDIYHVLDDFRKVGYIGTGIIIMLGEKQLWWHYLIDIGINLIVSSGTKTLGLYIANYGA